MSHHDEAEEELCLDLRIGCGGSIPMRRKQIEEEKLWIDLNRGVGGDAEANAHGDDDAGGFAALPAVPVRNVAVEGEGGPWWGGHVAVEETGSTATDSQGSGSFSAISEHCNTQGGNSSSNDMESKLTIQRAQPQASLVPSSLTIQLDKHDIHSKHAQASKTISIGSSNCLSYASNSTQLRTSMEIAESSIAIHDNGHRKRKREVKHPQHVACVSTTGNGPNGKTINGILYRYTKAEVLIMCVCHGNSFSPAEFVKHAGGMDVAHPLKHILIVSS